MTTLTCACGSRLNVAGLPPGKSGRCPTCGGPGRVPDSPASAPAGADDEWNWAGTYGIEPEPAPEVAPTPRQDHGWEEAYAVAEEPPPAPVAVRAAPAVGDRREPPAPEAWFPPRLFFPARGMEGVVMVVALGSAFWVIGTLVPEYCLALMADAEKIGTPTMGHLVMLITSIPVLLLSPLVLLYWLQYVARVLIAGAGGERTPPRPPDRDMDGLCAGLGAWASWVVLGLGGGLVPAAVGYAVGVRGATPLVGLGLLGVPYALMAFLLTFLHDEDLAARPWKVGAALARVGPSFLVLSLVVLGLGGAVGGAFAGLLELRDGHFGAYLVLALPCWASLTWMSIVAPQTLGAYYYARRGRLRWRRPPAWWTQV